MNRMTRSVSLVCLTALAVVSIAVPAAFAATVTPWESLSANVSTDPNAAVLIVSGTLPESTQLPATVELAAPSGSTLQWAGEILGGDISEDIEAATTKSVRDGQDIYTLTLTKSHIAQLEVTTVAPVTINGDVYMVDFSVPSWTDVPKFGIAVQIPVSAQLSEPPTGTAGLAAGPAGFQYYQQDFIDVKKGESLGLAFSYKLGAAAPVAGAAGATGSTGTSVVVPLLLVAVALALGVALVLGVRRKLAANAYDEDDTDDAPAASHARDESSDSSTAAEAFDDAAATAESADVDDEATVPTPRNNLALPVTVAVVAVMVIAGIVAGWQGGKSRATGGAITKTFSSGEACTNSTLALSIPEGTDAAQAAEQIFAAVALIPSVTAATIQLDTQSINVGYCESQANEDMVRNAIEPTGFLLPGGAVTTPSTEASASTETSGATN